MHLTDSQREYLRLLSTTREANIEMTVEGDGPSARKPSPDEARRNLDKKELRTAGVEESYADRPDKIAEEIESKVEKLPYRVNRLTEDIELLHKAGYLGIEHWSSPWAELLDIQELREEEFSPSANIYESDTPQEEFGRELGRMVYKLMSLSPKGIDGEEFHLGVLRGFVSGFTYDMLLPEAARINAELSDILDKHVEQSEKFIKDGPRGTSRTWELLGAISDEAISQIEQHLRAEGYEAPDDFVNGVRTAMEKEYYDGKELCLGVAEEASSKGELIIEEQITRERVRTVVEENDMYTDYQVRNQLRSDLNEMLSSSLRGITALDVIVSVPQEGGELGEVAEKVSDITGEEKSRTIPAVAKIGRFLACVEDTQLGNWEGYRILSIDQEKDGLKNWELKPTSYGELIKENVGPKTVKSAKETPEDIANPWDLLMFAEVPDDLREIVSEEVDL